MSTGVSVDDAVISQFNDFKLGRIAAKFLIYTISGGQISTHTVGTETSFAEFLRQLPENECRYALYDMEFTTNDGRPGKKLVFISWVPDTAKIKDKMVYAGSKDAMSRAFVGVATKVNATDRSELTEEIVVDACRKFA